MSAVVKNQIDLKLMEALFDVAALLNAIGTILKDESYATDEAVRLVWLAEEKVRHVVANVE